jgi:predicted  nucleic acid-binding Zn-ribbon protein
MDDDPARVAPTETGAAPEPGEPAGRDRSSLALLLDLQDEDLHAAQLRYRREHLSERQQLAAVDGRLAKLEAERRALAERRDALASRRDALDTEAGEVSARIRTIEERVRSGAVSSYRDQEALAAEIDSLSRRRGELEDEELAVMESIEPLEVELARLAAERAALEREADEARENLAQAIAIVDAELAQAAERRQVLVEMVPVELRAEYDRLRTRLDGVAVARLVRGTCDGCHLSLPATEIDQIRHAPPGAIFHCDQCGRILVP